MCLWTAESVNCCTV